MTTRKKNKNQQQKESGGFIKKVSSLFNLDTVMFYFFSSVLFLYFSLIRFFELLTIGNIVSFIFSTFMTYIRK